MSGFSLRFIEMKFSNIIRFLIILNGEETQLIEILWINAYYIFIRKQCANIVAWLQLNRHLLDDRALNCPRLIDANSRLFTSSSIL